MLVSSRICRVRDVRHTTRGTVRRSGKPISGAQEDDKGRIAFVQDVSTFKQDFPFISIRVGKKTSMKFCFPLRRD